ncbi:hypothetical protein [Azospirillum thermophilum]|uniref:hypothetical protein n=1 Tax=Azospirillum thermophilum TaxID=2202148 RepID=UPI0011B56DCE|nr:hypothetical protein [Azospirillum thermophilum]
MTKQFYKALHLVVRQIQDFARESGKSTDISLDRLSVSNPELASAFREAASDLRFLMLRRGFRTEDVRTKGVAEGKVAGMIAFRLLRHRIIHIGHTNPTVTDRYFGRLQELVVLRLVSESILGIDLDKSPFTHPGPGGATKPWLLHELLYLIARRHFNQETLALIFDTAVQLHKATSYSRA